MFSTVRSGRIPAREDQQLDPEPSSEPDGVEGSIHGSSMQGVTREYRFFGISDAFLS